MHTTNSISKVDNLVSLTEHLKVNRRFLAPRFKARNLKSIRKHLKLCSSEVIEYKNTREFITATTGIDSHLSPKCHKGEMGIRLPIRLRFLPFDVTYGHRLCKSRDQSVLKIRGSPYPDPDVKIYSRLIPAYRKVELR